MKTVGVIAGNGRFPLLAAKEALKEGYQVVVCGIEREADPALEKLADAFRWVKIGELKKLVKFFRSHGVHEAFMAGKVQKVRLFQENVRPDFEMVKLVAKVRDFKDDSLLSAVGRYLHEQGIDLIDSTSFMKNALPGGGILGRRKPSEEIMEDIRFGFQLAKSIAALDVGQTVVVKKKAVLAVEAVEGTDETIRRGGQLGGGKATVVKVAKSHQDMRFDVPTVGLGTLKALILSRAEAFAFEASKTLFIDQEEFVKRADQKGIALVGLKEEENASI